MVVHCSAGIGRTGALITMDVVLAMIERGLKFDIHKIVTDLRRQRQGMIQTKVRVPDLYLTVKDETKKVGMGHTKGHPNLLPLLCCKRAIYQG